MTEAFAGELVGISDFGGCFGMLAIRLEVTFDLPHSTLRGEHLAQRPIHHRAARFAGSLSELFNLIQKFMFNRDRYFLRGHGMNCNTGSARSSDPGNR